MRVKKISQLATRNYMPDVFTQSERSRVMASVRGEHTAPEILVRSIVHRLGYRFRLHRKDLPGKPDIVLPRHGKIIFIHGCFWHQHGGCKHAARPASNTAYWNKKLDRNMERDKTTQRELKRLGWKPLIIWECELKNRKRLVDKIKSFLIR